MCRPRGAEAVLSVAKELARHRWIETTELYMKARESRKVATVQHWRGDLDQRMATLAIARLRHARAEDQGRRARPERGRHISRAVAVICTEDRRRVV